MLEAHVGGSLFCKNFKKFLLALLKPVFRVLSKVEGQRKLFFPWFTLHDLEGEADAYTRFVAALCHMAQTTTRVTARERDIENEKFTFRLFLIRLGFVGTEYKTARKILLRNLSGNSSWKSGHPPVRETQNEGGAPYEK